MPRITDLLGAEVVDRDGRRLGRVRDVRLVQDGQLPGFTHDAWRLDAVIVGGGGLGTLFGYGHGEIERPVVLRWLFQHLRRGHDVYRMRDLDWDVDGRRLRRRR